MEDSLPALTSEPNQPLVVPLLYPWTKDYFFLDQGLNYPGFLLFCVCHFFSWASVSLTPRWVRGILTSFSKSLQSETAKVECPGGSVLHVLSTASPSTLGRDPKKDRDSLMPEQHTPKPAAGSQSTEANKVNSWESEHLDRNCSLPTLSNTETLQD